MSTRQITYEVYMRLLYRIWQQTESFLPVQQKKDTDVLDQMESDTLSIETKILEENWWQKV